MFTRKTRFALAAAWLSAICANGWCAAGLPPGGPRGGLRPTPQQLGVLTYVPSPAGGERGIAVRVLPPPKPRYDAGAPVVIHVAGGVEAGAAVGRPEFAGLGFVEVFFGFPGGGEGEAASGGTYDFRGPNCTRALADVIRFATGRAPDKQGRRIDDLAGNVKVLKANCGLLGSSHGGNACGLVMARHGEEFADLAWYASMESPYGEGAVPVELGGFDSGLNPAYDAKTGVLDLGRLAWSDELPAAGFPRRFPQRPSDLRGALYFDINRDGRFSSEDDFPANVFLRDVGGGMKTWYSPRLLREAERRLLFGKTRPPHVPTVAEAGEFWREREASAAVPEAVRKCPGVAVIVYAGERDHVQVAPDHPHILVQVEGFRQAQARFVRLNPDRAYVERILQSGPMLRAVAGRAPADNDAGRAWDRGNIREGLEPAGPPIGLYMQAAVCELADRTQAGNWAANLDAVLYPQAPWDVFAAAPPGAGPPPRPDLTDRPAENDPQRRPDVLPATPDGRGTRPLQVDASKTVGRIRSLSGTNRGPISFPRQADQKAVSHIENYRAMGIDFIRTHDFYGPTDWHVIFPTWAAGAEQAGSYDFRSSDPVIRAIAENGFRCFYRLGTSWKGRQTRPINDPPGTVRGPDGQVTHQADRKDFQKWAAICAQTVRHYTEGWSNGFRFPIEYWEIWNEPDLAAQFWTGTPEQYYALYEEAARAVKAVNPKLKVGGPACTGALRRAYVEDFIRYCRDRNVPLDFFSWHSYGGRGRFNPYQFYENARRVRGALDAAGFGQAENILTEWNAGIQETLFSDTPAGAAFYASTLACLLDAGVDRAFQYCGDQHPGLGLHDLRTGDVKICGYAFTAWKRLMETPDRVAAEGGDAQGYNIVAGRDAEGLRVRVLISNFQSGPDAFRLRAANLPWGEETPFRVRRRLLDGQHRLEVVEEVSAKGKELVLERPLRPASVCLIEIDREPKAAGGQASEPAAQGERSPAEVRSGLAAHP
jgi:hypothetical protein